MRVQTEIVLILLLLLIAAAVCMAAKILRPIILNVGLEKNFCPNCGSSLIKKSSPRRYPDMAYRIFGLRPFRCTICEVRFFAFHEPAKAGMPSNQGRTAGLGH